MSREAWGWGCAHVQTHQEQWAVARLRRQGFTAMYPFFAVGRGADAHCRALFPGYVFVLLEHGMPWSAINSTRGVIRLLASQYSGVPHLLDDEFAASLRRCLVPSPDGPSAIIAPGTLVRVRSGPLSQHEAVVKWSTHDRLGLLFKLFRREVEVEFSCEDVEVVEA